MVSDQTVPNITFIKTAKVIFDEYWFITTEYSEGLEKDGSFNIAKSKSNWIIDTCDIADKSKKIIVVEDDLIGIQAKIQAEVSENENHSFVLNMTGGTKMMSLGAFLFFQPRTEEIYYKPIGKNHFKKINSNEEKEEIPLTIKDYLSGYGILYPTIFLRQ